ncbi:MAG: SDR family NAD(P)-dependent oxidoreductase [Nostoc sp. DedQUE05]|uniref:SDR family NAD(P)-dependent oxidoreductase n=1 Tax=Nostoc sp. DedQUE05 TaxID=3075391 RepID=UPI002AD44D19|nr:SDR family NAD(P)-dependent oxidoreductase [Nostoc sp. DedQUE05]MDZ8091985.1 SDR family NAD(P)-dependent oxidoreductase [Nostoc sp. DedQUE05]
MVNATHNDALEAIAIIGMAGRFPDAKNIEEFWQNLQSGVESISLFTNEEVVSDGIEPNILSDRNYVKASAILKDIDLFDASFFSFNPKEAEITDPQHRIFLECALEALENAGYDSKRCDSRIGVYAGASLNNYYSLDLNRDRLGSAQCYQTVIGNDKDFLTTRVSYKLNLTGPSITVQTACSTSLVATTLACQSLLNYQCDMALAGGVSIHVPQKTGYLYEPGGTLSPDGHCRAFDAKAQGTTIGNGVGIVVLKRLSDALADGDRIHAVIKGSAINNDGSGKVGYTAPSVNGQAEVIAEAMMLAGVEPETINYIEAHGTGTALGDPIEIAALSQVFRNSTIKKGFCAIASVKTNIGHLDAAAGIAGLIKTVLALKHQQIPPSLNFEQPNPQIDFANSPFYVNTTLTEWKAGSTPRRAGVSSLGIGGTNAHVILEEAPVLEPSSPSRPWQLLVLSAKTDSALETATENLANHLQQHPDVNLADVAHTLQVGRGEFNHRRVLVCQDIEDAASALRDPQRVLTRLVENSDRPIAFMFPGQGAQYVDMGKELYQTEPVFQEQVDFCCQLLQPHLELDLRSVIYPKESESKAAAEKLQQTDITQPALFIIEYALAQLWISWGISAQAMIGHSIGEYVAACLADVMSVEDALRLVAARGRLMQQLPFGAMLSVPLPEAEVRGLLNENLSLAASNAPALCVVSGTNDAIDALQNQLQGIDCRRLHTSHAFHSPMMETILEPFEKEVSKVKLNPPKIPFISNVTGTWITAEQATDPNYWARHLRSCVRFSEGISALLQEPNRILLEVGPGHTLSTFAKKHSEPIALSSLRHPQEKHSDVAFLMNTLGKLWLSGVNVDWSGFYAHERRHRLPLPTYPFERQRYWIHDQKPAPTVKTSLQTPVTSVTGKKSDIADWFYVPSWKRSPLPEKPKSEKSVLACTLVFTDECGLGEELVNRLKLQGRDAIALSTGSELRKLSDRHYTLNPQQRDDYDALLKELLAENKFPNTIVHLWNVTPVNNTESAVNTEDLGFYSLLFLAQALGKHHFSEQLQIAVISNNMQEVTGDEILYPEKATILGPVKVIPKEYLNISCRSIDITTPSNQSWHQEKLIDQLLSELQTQSSDSVIAYRGNHRWVQQFEPVSLEPASTKIPKLQEKGVYLITGGLGGIGLVLAEHLAKTVKAKLLLTGRSSFPAKDEWSEWLKAHGEQDSISCKIQKLQKLEQLGAEILVVSADVTNIEQMQNAIAKAQEHFGKFNGVIHAAGIPGGGIIQLKTAEMTAKVLAPKVKGTLVINSIFQDTPLDFFVLCSSMTAIQGELGQVDYASANAFLDAFAHYKSNRDSIFTTSINWSAWQEVGMAATAANISTPSQIVKPQFQAVNHPLFEQCIVESSEQEIYISKFSVIKHWVLNEHIVMGKATLPGTAYLEMARAAFEKHRENRPIEISEVYFLTPLVVEGDEEKEVRTLLKKQGDKFEFSIISQSSSEGDKWLEHARGEIAFIETEFTNPYDIEAIIARCNEQEITNAEREIKLQGGYIEFGSRWNNFKQAKFGTNEGLAILEIPSQFANDINLYKLHPALLDNAVGFLSIKEKSAYLPFSYKKLKFRDSLPEKVYSHIRCTKNDKSRNDTLKFDITIMDDQGKELVEIEEYTLRKVDVIPQKSPISESQNFCLQISSPGTLDTLTFQSGSRQQPGRGEVEIEVAATGLNFKEVLLALGMLPMPTDADLKFGLECAGKIVALGEGVEGFEIGDEVIAFGDGCFSRFLTTSALSVALKPKHLSLEAAATIPVAFTTAYYSLMQLGRLSKGDRVLIHAAAGGVGMAAVQIAQWIGAEIFATAGNPEKRAFLHSIGIEYVFDSRSVAFADEVMQRTHGKGVDVVLNSLAGEFLTKSLDVLAPYGRFLEIGKRDILNNSQLGLKVFAKCLSFFAINVDRQLPNFSDLWREVVQHFHQRNFQPLPYQVFAIDSVARAFEEMARAKHIGKIVVSLENQDSLSIGENKDTKVSVAFSPREPKKSVTPAQTYQKQLLEQGLSPAEGIEALNRILENTLSQVLVSTHDFRLQIKPDLVNYSPNPEATNKDNLSKPTYSRPELSTTYIAPRNEIEQKISLIWQELLGSEQVGIHDNFFELGGDSLLMVQVRSKLQAALNCDISTADLFEYPTINVLAGYLSQTQNQQPAFEQAQERAKRQEAAIEEEMELMKLRRRVYE